MPEFAEWFPITFSNLNFSSSWVSKMASNPGKWEIVGKDGKPRKNTAGNKKSKAKINEADLPKLDIKGTKGFS